MPPALWKLLHLHFRGTRRKLLRGVRTPRGAIFLALGIMVLFLWLGPSLYMAVRMPRSDSKSVLIAAPFAILAFCLGNLLTSAGEQAVAFTAAEVDFLFPGPFTRRSLLGYKILKTALGTATTAAIFSIILLRYSSSWLACFIGIWLTIQFMQLFAIAVVMITQTLGERLTSGARRAVVLGVLAVVIVAAAPRLAAAWQAGPLALMQTIHATAAGKVLLAPFDVFARAFTAATPASLLKWSAVALAIDLLLLGIVIGLDANYLETVAAVSQRRYERMQRYRRGGAAGMTGGGKSRLRIKPLPWLGGIGPIAWRQITSAARSSRGLLVILAIVTVTAGTIVMRHRGEEDASMSSMIGLFVWINIFFVTMLKFDFRDELDRLDFLRSLPIHPLAVAAAELVAPVLVLTLVQAVLIAAAAMSFANSAQVLVPAAAFAIPFNVLLVGIENLLFLMFPLRAAGLIAGDMQLFGRQMVVFLCKFLLLVVALAIAAAFGTVGYIIGGKSWPAFGVVAWVALTLIALAIIPFLARAYSRFDPSVDTPA